MRLSATQKDVLYILFSIEARGRFDPVPGMKLLGMLNLTRSSEIHDTNFRTSCHTLVANGLLSKYRSSSLMLAFTLTADGREKAKDIYQTRADATS
mgnify:FL=1